MKAVTAFLLVLCCLAVSHAWNCSEAPLLHYANQIDAGMGKVVATNRYRQVFSLSGLNWYRLGTVSLKHVTVGPSGTWGTDYSNYVYKYVAGNFKRAAGLKMEQVDAGGDGQVVGVTPRTTLTYCLREPTALSYAGVGSLGWSYLSRRMKYFSCGPLLGCWGVDSVNNVYVARNVYASNCRALNWVYVSGQKMKMIEVSTDGQVFGVTTTGKVYQRTGITSYRRQGTRWTLIPMCMSVKHLSYDLRQLWIVTNSGLLMKCTH
ncbi:Hypothetical protein SMAX5B_021398 [Scophthalmus maximus]|uniref:Fish-egg lectin-like n=1 Tax=Scophthalmus maximus TaxID=52904 RepID=A0A2U9B214_SCOMX|nr:fish-egg lectin [Scophthalmus maximus]AWO97801.1 Hypothetical protein SMAX5B_021398 [Scophthalmus maximus]